jgi:hypothetical protein
LYDGEHGSYAYATSGAYYSAEVVNVCGFAQGTNYVSDVVAFVEGAQFVGAGTYSLHHQGYGAFLCVASGNGKWHTFAFFAYAYNYKMSGFACLSNQRGFYFQLENFLAKLFLAYNLVHFLT